jgi:cold shock CspA family protein
MPPGIYSGTIVQTAPSGTFAFIKTDGPIVGANDDNELFAHKRSMSSAVQRHLRPGLRVQFNVQASSRKPGMMEAVAVQLPGAA